MCGQCDRFYCSRHAGQPVAGKKASCKVCAIGETDKGYRREAGELVTEIINANKPASPGSEVILSQEQAARLLDILLSMLASSQNESVRSSVAKSLGPIVEYSQYPPNSDSLVPEWSLYQLAWKSLRALIEALGDEEYWVRFEAAGTLIRERCLQSFRPIVELWLEKDINAFPSNIMQHLQGLADDDENAKRELQQVLTDLHAGGSGLSISRGDKPDRGLEALRSTVKLWREKDIAPFDEPREDFEISGKDQGDGPEG